MKNLIKTNGLVVFWLTFPVVGYSLVAVGYAIGNVIWMAF